MCELCESGIIAPLKIEFDSTNPIVIDTCLHTCDNSVPDICGCTPYSCQYYPSLCEMERISNLIKHGFHLDSQIEESNIINCVSTVLYSSNAIDQICSL